MQLLHFTSCLQCNQSMGSFHCLYRRFCDWVCRWNDRWSRVSASHETETRREGWKLLLPDYRQRQNSGCRTKRECCAVSSGWNTIMKIVVFYRVLDLLCAFWIMKVKICLCFITIPWRCNWGETPYILNFTVNYGVWLASWYNCFTARWNNHLWI